MTRKGTESRPSADPLGRAVSAAAFVVAGGWLAALAFAFWKIYVA